MVELGGHVDNDVKYRNWEIQLTATLNHFY